MGPFRASDPVRFNLGGLRGAGASTRHDEALRGKLAEADAQGDLLQVFMEHIESNARLLQELNRHLRLQRDRVYTEIMYAKLDVRAEPQSGTQDQFRVTYIWASVGGGKTATLHLKGGQSGDTLTLPIPANTQPPLQVVLGDGDTGGLILGRSDMRYVTVDDGSAQQIVCLLCGEVLKDSFLS